MAFPKTIIFTVGIISSFLIQTQGADKYTDGNRPYEFGFKIDGEQHRHEMKDEKGLIMGEFGFITADGVYHVTVYATDEQGRYKILSMKNIRVKPYPTYKRPETGSARQGHSLDTQTIPNGQNLAKPETPPKTISIEPPGKSCSSCSLPTTTQAPVSTFVQSNVQNTPYRSNGNNSPAIPQYTQGAKANSFPNQQDAFNGQNVQSTSFPENKPNSYNDPQTYSQQSSGPSQIAPGKELVAPKPDSPSSYTPNGNNLDPNSPSAIPQYIQEAKANQQGAFNGQNVQSPSFPENKQNNVPQTYSQQNSGPSQTAPEKELVDPRPLSKPQSTQSQGFGPDNQSVRDNISSGRNPKKYDGPQQSFGSADPQPNGISNNDAGFNQGQTLPKKPTLISAQIQIVDKNTDIHQRGPGEKEGLPNGLTKEDMTQLLYTFNYTVGFHGHFEEGYRSGAKQGYYYVTGRNGVRTRVDYVADEKGFRPKISQEVLDLLSDDVPKPETEKDEKYGLKGYEFKWLYYPVEYNKQ